jgi:hypothetical protein
MVAKLLLAIEENFFAAIDDGADPATCRALGELYYRVREGIGFNKSPQEYGAFPTDPYSHTPKHAGARQPGMTGQVKEEILCRFAELGVRVLDGEVKFEPALLRRQEFSADPGELEYLDVDGDWKTVAIPANGLAFTWCQVPVVYRLDDDADAGVTLHRADGSLDESTALGLTADDSMRLFRRNGDICRVTVSIPASALFRN